MKPQLATIVNRIGRRAGSFGVLIAAADSTAATNQNAGRTTVP